MPAPNHLGMFAQNRYEELDDAPVDPVFDYEVDDSRKNQEVTDNRESRNRQQTPYYNSDKTNTSKASGELYNRDNTLANSRNTDASKAYDRNSEPSRNAGRDNSEPSRNFSRYKAERSEYDLYPNTSGTNGTGNYSSPARSLYESVNGRYEEEPYSNEPELEKARQVYNRVKAEDLYSEEGFVAHKDEPLFRERNHMVDERVRHDPYLDDRYFDEDDEMGERSRHGEMGIHRGKRVIFFRNGDSHYKGLQTSISKKQFSSIESLIIWLNEKIPTTCGVRYIFSLGTGQQLRDIDEIHTGGKYVVSSSRSVIQVSYGKGDNLYWRNKALSAGKIRRAEVDLFFRRGQKQSQSYPGSRAESNRTQFSKYPSGLKPRLLTIMNNLHRDKVQKVILNPKTTQNFDEMIKDIGSMLQVPGEDKFTVTALYTAKPPHRKVQSFSQLGDILGTLRTSEKRPNVVCSEFIACGKEKFPMEMLVKNHKHNKEHSRPTTDRYPDDYVNQPALLPNGADINGDPEDMKIPASEPDTLDQQSSLSEATGEIDFEQKNNSDKSEQDDNIRWPRDDLRQSQDTLNESGDLSKYTQNTKQTQSPPVHRRGPSKDKPYRKSMPEIESIKVHIHGNLREFFVPRYGQYDGEGNKPDKDIELNWVYGYRGIDAHNNLYTLISGELLYYVASVAVIYDKSREKQRHYREHTEDITCMAVLEDGSSPRIASGQLAGKYERNSAHVRIWDPFSMITQCVIGQDYFQNAVVSVAFSNYTGIYKRGSLLLAIDDSNKHVMSVWDWQKGHVIAKTPTSADSVVWGTFHPDDHQTIVTFGKQHIYFWWLDWKGDTNGTARLLRDKQSGLMPINDLPMFVTSIAFAPAAPSSNKRADRAPVGHVITGDSNGCITVWDRDAADAYVINQRCSEAMKHAHNKTVFALCMMKEGTLLSAGGGEIKAWDTSNNYRPVKSRNIPSGTGTVRTMVPRITSSMDGSLFVGTTSNCILEGSLQDKFTVCVAGHSEEIWALDTHPSEQVYVSAGYDQFVTKWSMQSHKPLWRTYIEKPGMSVAFSPDGNLVVVGTTLGRFIVMNAHSGHHVTSVQVASDLEALDGIKFSPDGRLLAMGSHDGTIYVYESEDEGKVYRAFRNPKLTHGQLKGHSNPVHYLDWSNDSKYLQSVSEDYDLLCWDITHMKEVPAEMMREVEWFTQTCVLNYNILGAWSNLKEGEDITTSDRSKDTDTIAVGDNHGRITLYRYPCTCEKPEYHKHKPYSGRINKLMYSCDDRFLITSGGIDAGLMQWVIV